MCEYSLELTSRPAKVGDKLVSTSFPTRLRGVLLRSTSPMWPFACFPAPNSPLIRRCETGSLVFYRGHTVAKFQEVNKGLLVTGR